MSGNEMVQFNRDTQAALHDFQKSHGLTLKQLGQKLGRNEGFVNKYLNGVPEGDIASFEERIADMLKREARKRSWDNIYFPTEAADACFNVFDLVREASDIGLVHGPAGFGKSVAFRKYLEDHRTVIGFTAMEGSGSPYDVMRGISSGIDMRRWNSRETKLSDYLFVKLNGSERCVLIDNAQRLYLSGFRWLMDFHDNTGVSFVLIGNPEVMDKLNGNDQLSSRIGIQFDISSAIEKKDWLDDAADQKVSKMWPKAQREIGILAREAARKPGHLRTLDKQLRIAITLCEADAYKGKYAKAFADARNMIGAESKQE